jgi:hypothetical protein
VDNAPKQRRQWDITITGAQQYGSRFLGCIDISSETLHRTARFIGAAHSPQGDFADGSKPPACFHCA